MNPDLSQTFFNRELSWLEFNQRVLNEAIDVSTPTLERLKFLSIFSSNLDEFFMVRVGGLHLAIKGRDSSRDLSGLRPEEQLKTVSERVRKMVADHYDIFNHSLVPALREAGIKFSSCNELNELQLTHVERFFYDEVYSSLTPIATEETNFPLLPNQTINLGFRLEVNQQDARPLINHETLFDERFVVIPLGKKIPRFVFVPSDFRLDIVFTEDIIRHFSGEFFHKQQIMEAFVFRVTRNADMRLDDREASNLVKSMEDLLDERTVGDCVRLEVDNQISTPALEYLKKNLEVSDQCVFACNGPLATANLMQVATANGFDDFKDEPWQPQAVPTIDPTESIFDAIKRSNHVLFHPYQSYDPVIRLISEASNDDNVLAIKQTLYRTSRESKVVQSLQRAAESGKNVTVVLELKARFDEARNIAWAKQLEHAGANVIYGVKGLKTHAKATLIVRRETSGITRYCHFGTGNYNEQTAKLYTDVSLLTCDPDLGSDAAEFFNSITGYSRPQTFRKLEMAPNGMRDKFLDLIAIETANAKAGRKAFIRAKINSLADRKIIESLYKASQAGVTIDLNVRGICCLRPGMADLSQNIRVVSLIDRFLEHARIFHFHHNGDEMVFISSADWMSRNLDQRIELLVPIDDEHGKNRLIAFLKAYFLPNDKAYQLDFDGNYSRIRQTDRLMRGKSQLSNTQHKFYQQASQERIDYENRVPTSFTPHTSS